jgi:small subunit ribosomal protein S1
MSSVTPPEPVNEQAEVVPTEAVSPDNAPAPQEQLNNPATSLSDLQPKMELQGIVKSTELQGAIVDIGLEKHGLLHISQLSEEPVKNVTDVVKKGDQVTVFVLAVDKTTGRLDLSLIRPLDVTVNEIKVGERVEGTVERIERYGVFVNVGAERPGMIHVSELATGYVNDPSEVVKIGDTVEAKVIGVNKRKKQIDLSIRALEAEEMVAEVEEEDQGEYITAMELALRKAMNTEDDNRRGSKKRDKKRKTREQEDIIERTLRWNQQ